MRKLALFLTANGFPSETVFFPGNRLPVGHGTAGTGTPDPADIAALIRFLKPFDVVGISGFSDFVGKADVLGTEVRRAYPRKPILMGGVAAIVDPAGAISRPWADAVCTGEGELPTLSLLSALRAGRSWHKTPGFVCRDRRGRIHTNVPGRLIDVDRLPMLDYTRGVIVEGGCVTPVTADHLKSFFGTTLWISGSRGCPFHCAYCINSTLPAAHKRPRFHSREYVVGELVKNLTAFPFFNGVYFNDESVTAQPKERFHALLELYRTKVGLPWSCYADPFTITGEDVDRMIAAGCRKFKIGMQSGSGKVGVSVFNRADALWRFPSILRRIDPRRRRLSLPVIDLISDVPWVTDRDKADEVRLINSLPRPFTMEVFSLAYYPGTKLYERALTEHIISKGQRRPQDHVAGSRGVYAGIFLRMLGMASVPSGILDILIDRGWVFSQRRIPVVPDILRILVSLRKLRWQLRSGDPTLLPYALGRMAAPSWGTLGRRKTAAATRRMRVDPNSIPARTGPRRAGPVTTPRRISTASSTKRKRAVSRRRVSQRRASLPGAHAA